MSTVPSLTPDNRPTATHDVRSMFNAIAPTYDVLNSVLSCGLHRLWERRLVATVPVCKDGRFLDLCTGTGALVPRLAPRCREIVGVDVAPEMLRIARAKWKGISNATWIEGDAQALAFDDQSFDVVTVAYGVRNLPQLEVGLSEIARVLKPGGVVGILEFGQPSNRLWRRIFRWYARGIIPWLGGLLSGERAAYEYLPITAEAFPCGQSFERLLRSQGLQPHQTHALMGGVAYIYIAVKQGASAV